MQAGAGPGARSCSHLPRSGSYGGRVRRSRDLGRTPALRAARVLRPWVALR
jgi:hypothetical protein